MADDLILAPEARQDLEEAYAWYERRQLGLGEVFLSRVDACLQAILRRPEMLSPVLKDYRRALVRRLPCAVFHEYSDGVVTVYGVFHTSRDPKKWRRRLA